MRGPARTISEADASGAEPTVKSDHLSIKNTTNETIATQPVATCPMCGRRLPGRPTSEAAGTIDRDRVLDLWAADATTRQIGVALGVSHTTAWAVIERARRAGDPRAVRRQPGRRPRA